MTQPVFDPVPVVPSPAAARVLVAEDDPVSRDILRTLVESWGYQAIVVEDGTQTLDALEGDDPPRLAILDWMMPGVHGVDICRRLRAREGTPYTYIIVLTALTEPERLVEAMDAGADDFVGKPFQPHELEARLRAGRRVIDLMSELTRAREALRELATIDAMTQLWNRRFILEHLDKELARRDRDQDERGIGVLLADLDHFKTVNDTHGHPVGDEVLIEAARRIRALVRRRDEVGRLGGEEFLAVVGSCDLTALGAVAERIRTGVGRTPIVTAAGPVNVKLSIGGALHRGPSPTSAATLIEAADRALYRAKAAGRNRVVIAPRSGRRS